MGQFRSNEEMSQMAHENVLFHSYQRMWCIPKKRYYLYARHSSKLCLLSPNLDFDLYAGPTYTPENTLVTSEGDSISSVHFSCLIFYDFKCIILFFGVEH